jgi:hypothetical protein
MFSYAALQTRLAENTFAKDGLVDFTGPVIRLKSLSPEDLFVLLQKVRHVYAGGDRAAYLMPDEGIKAFMTHCSTRIGDAYFRTPRSTVREFVNLLAVLEQNRSVSWQDLIGGVQIKTETNPDLEPPPNGDADSQDHGERAQPTPGTNDDLTSFKL